MSFTESDLKKAVDQILYVGGVAIMDWPETVRTDEEIHGFELAVLDELIRTAGELKASLNADQSLTLFGAVEKRQRLE